MDPVLFVRQAAHFQSMDLDRVEDVRGLQSSPRSRLRSSRGDRAGSVPCGRQCVVKPEQLVSVALTLGCGKFIDRPATN
jgi:hypothetical protein